MWIYTLQTLLFLFLQFLCFTHLINPQTTMIMGAREKRRRIKTSTNKLGPNKAAGLCGMHAITGCDTTGDIQGKGKLVLYHIFYWVFTNTIWKIKGKLTYKNAEQDVIKALSYLGIGDTPNNAVNKGCEKYICDLLTTKQAQCYEAKELRWHMFRQLKSNQGVERLPPTQGAIHQLVLRAHYQCHI